MNDTGTDIPVDTSSLDAGATDTGTADTGTADTDGTGTGRTDAGGTDATPAPDAADVAGTGPALVPASAEEIPDLRVEIDAIDAELLRLIARRTEISQRIGLARMAAGGPRIVYNREMAVLARFRDLGSEGRELAMMLLRLGRGRLGGRA